MPAEPEAYIDVEVVYALPHEQILFAVRVPQGSTIREAIRRSQLTARYPDLDLEHCAVGVLGERVAMDNLATDGARIEIYRALIADPKDARRRRASKRAARPQKN